MPTNVVPTLDTNGWLTGVAEKADALMAYFLTSDYSQSYAHFGQVKSLQYYIQQYPRDHMTLRNVVESAVTQLYNAYFDNVSINVSVLDPDVEETATENRLEIKLDVVVNQGGKEYSLGKLVAYLNNKLHKVVDVNRI